jgi:hypothetical protein
MSAEEEERQKELSLRWETKNHWPDLRKEFGATFYEATSGFGDAWAARIFL